MSVQAPLRVKTSERTTFKYAAVLSDEDGFALPLSAVSALELTLLNARDGSVINSRNEQNILNANQVTYSTSTGELVWRALGADSPMVNDDAYAELHIAHFHCEYGSVGELNWKLIVEVENTGKVRS